MSELYVTCPKCRGSRFVSAIVRPGDGFRPTLSAEFPCDLCHMTGEAAHALALQFEAERAAAEYEDSGHLFCR